MDPVEEIKAKAIECQNLKSSITKLESKLETSTLQFGSLQAKLDTSLKESQDLQNQLDAAKTQVNQHEKEIQAKNIEVEDLNLQFERARKETEKALQKKTEELLTSATKLTEINELLESFKEANNSQEQQIIALNEENEKTSKACKEMTQVKESLEKEISILQNASQASSVEIKRLSATISSKDIEIESLKTDLASLSSQLQQLKEVINQKDREVKMLDEKLKKAETDKETLEKSKEEAIQALNDKETPRKTPSPRRSRKNSDVEEGQNDEEMEMPGCFESAKEASLLLFLGVFGQSWDVYSDIALSIQFANGIGGNDLTHPTYAVAVMVPVALSFIFNIRQWWKNEDGLKKKLISVPFLILQLYPSFAAYRLVVYLITRDKKWFDAKKIYDTSMSSIEPFLESIPQCHVLLTILLASQKIPFRTDTYNEGVIEASYFFTATFLTSIFSATFGMTKLLKIGPCAIVSRTKYGLGFMLIFLSILFCMGGKGVLLALMINGLGFHVPGLTLCLETCYILPMLYQFGVFVRHQGWKNALQTCLDYPALLMMPTFSSWSFGASEKKSCCSCERSSEVGVSFTVTLINSMITLGGLAITSVYFLQRPELLANLKEQRYEVATFFLPFLLRGTFLPVIVSMILMSIVACLDNFSCCACSCCCDCCLPMTERDSIFKTEKEDTNEILKMQTLEAVNQEAE